MKVLLRYLKNLKSQLFWGTSVKFIETAGDIIVPFLMAMIIDKGIGNKDIDFIVFWCGIILLIEVVGLISSVINQRMASVVGQGIGKHIRHDMYVHINTFTHKELDKFGTSTLITRFSEDVTRIDNGIEIFIRQFARAPFLLLGSMIMMIIIAPKLALIMLIIAPIIIAIIYIIMKKSNYLYGETQKNFDEVALQSRENLSGAKVIRAFNRQKSEKSEFLEATQKLYVSQRKVGNISALLNPLTSIVVNFGIIAILWFGAVEVNIGSLTQGNMIAFADYLIKIGAALVAIARIIIMFTKAGASLHRVQEVFNVESSIEQKTKEYLPAIIDDDVPKIEFKNVSFKYGKKSKYAISNLNLKIMRGQTVGIIGGTGSGKTSLINLIPRYYEATSGKVLIDGIDVREYSFNQLRGQIGVVPQKAVLFRGKIIENMLWRKENATIAEINKALDISQSTEFVNNFKDGLEHKLTAGGANLSGGQRQRLTIARALVGDPEILILDDSSSALDFATDAKLRKAIKTQIKNTTMLLVTQRATIIKDADVIVCIDKGEIVGIGKHSELMKDCNIYREIYESQTK